MGARGPKPLPANVHRLRNNPSKLRLDQLAGGVEPEVEIPNCPKHLLPEARKEWKRIAVELEALGLVSSIDRAALALYCQAWAWWVWHENLLQRDIRIAAEQQAAHDATEAKRVEEAVAAGETYTPKAWSGGDGFMIATPNGSFTYNPHWVAKNKAAAEVDKFLASFGMSPSSRGRVTASSRQMTLPGVDNPAGGFAAV